jgi:hypothetical protein
VASKLIIMAENRMRCHIFHGAPEKVQQEMSDLLETKKNMKIHSAVQSQSTAEVAGAEPRVLISITLLYTDLDVEREHILGFTDKR